MNRALIACGGTGGHLSPGIALAQELMSRGWRCQLLISSKKVDTRLVEKYTDFEYETISGSGLTFRPLGFLRFIRDFVKGYRSCLKKIDLFKPDVVIGFGGFISAPSLLAGARKGAKIAIHEANRVPGRATRLTSRIADRIYLPEGVHLKEKQSDRVRSAGIPLRSEFNQKEKSAARKSLGLEVDRKTLLVFGGSQGARSLTDWSIEHANQLEQGDIQLICLSGLGYVKERKDAPNGCQAKQLARFLDFSDDMSTLLSAADLVVSRAGAGSLAEIARCGAPAVLIPYPFAADDHQVHNAERFEEQGGGVRLSDKQLDRLYETVDRLIADDEQLEIMRDRLRSMDASNSRAEIADDIEALVSNTKSVGLELGNEENALR
ncbi:MAG: UDP-N-acetylglucosamine--N-acetylmuramyl-(pentapeptide) pyrophosphoryl-undecaprenol N-acetylglucosamine transferase [Opitutaceae bacterium]|nr:UDP-N-acetylglucosamine--N-acetylmuramyl-(pentapeptide) pyrophosphoryl-undecaprenol N-acetylglucosamine transferase [Opitutaceae bacterium]